MASERDSSPHEATLIALLAARAERDPEAAAILGEDGARFRYAALHDAVRGIRDALAELDLAGRRIALSLPAGPELALAFLGVAAGATAAPLDPARRCAELEAALSKLRIEALIADAAHTPDAVEAARRQGVPVLDLDDLRRDRASSRAAAPDPDAIALLLQTSGTTAAPKTVPLTHAKLVASARGIAEWLDLGAEDRCLNVMPLFHVHGLVGGLLASLAAGGSVVCTQGFRAADFFPLVERFLPTWYTAVPTIHRAILARAPQHADTIASCPLRFIRSSSAALPVSLIGELEGVFGAPLIEAYGMTEAAHQVASSPRSGGARKPGSVGLPTGPEIAVMMPDGAHAGAGATGEIVLRGGALMDGYEDDAGANREAFRDGWFRTGDSGHLDTDGYVFLTGRIKEIINRGGEKIAPPEVEETLLAHPAVVEAVAFAIPDRRLGEDVGAAVVVAGAGAPTADELRRYVADRLAEFKVPRVLQVVDRIPCGPTGKPQRNRLAAALGIDAASGRRPPGRHTPPRTDAERAVAELWRDVLGHEKFGVEDDFFDAGGDSMAAGELLAAMARDQGVDIPLLSFLDRPTIEGMVAEVEKLAGIDAFVGIGGVRLAKIRDQGQQPPLFMMGGHDNVLWGLSALARYLPEDQPVLGVQTPAQVDHPAYSLEELAAWIVGTIRTIQPEGPYHLAGHCFGGWAMFEAARQLVGDGHRVALLTMMECFNEGGERQLSLPGVIGFRLGLWRRRHMHRQAMRDSTDGSLAYVGARAVAFVRSLGTDLNQAAFGFVKARGWRAPHWLRTPLLANRSAEACYTPAPYDGRTLLVSVGESAGPEPGSDGVPASCEPVLTGPVEHVHVYGDRQRMWSYPCVRQVGEAVAARMAAAAAADRA